MSKHERGTKRKAVEWYFGTPYCRATYALMRLECGHHVMRLSRPGWADAYPCVRPWYPRWAYCEECGK